MGAGVGFEPTTSRLLAWRATRLLYPAIKDMFLAHGTYLNHVILLTAILSVSLHLDKLIKKQDAINYLCATTAPPTACGRQDWIRTNDTKFPNLKVNCCMHPF